ncbi:protein FAR1-RELATED SEQUENCE [Citrus sinensis]|uniref:Protein FAR1-RELATED SEQUENCE n=1 Tax=Citrus sinensis TaxID=2711 RepID=A0ACB8I166_CITSI|nr:protein FAR1-RELATED SEQUENCE [Citrus sinensis]
MAENVDEGNENDFKENDNDRIKLGKCFKNLSEEEKAKFRMVGSDIAWNKDKEDDFVKGTQKAMETRCAPDRFAKLVAKLSENKKKAVVELGFESLLHIKCGRLKRDLCSWLVQNFDPFTSCIFLHGKSINLSPRDFEYIMGIKDGGVDIDVDLDIDDIDKLKNEYCDDSGYIKLKTLESKLVNQRELFYMDSISFARKFIDKSLSPITTWTNRDVTNLLSFVKKNGGYGSSKVNLREIHPQQNTAQETFDGTSRKNEECIHNCQHQKELSLVRKDIGRMALELDGLKHSMGSWMQQMQQVMETLKENLTQKQVEQQKENNGATVGITSPSRKQQKNDESSHEILTFAELMKRAKERPDGDDILEKKLLDKENVEEKHDERILTGESDLNEGKRKQIFYNAAIQDNGRNDDCSIEEESSNQLSVFEVKDMRSRKRKPEEDMKLLQYIFQGELPMDEHIVDGISFFVSRQEMFSLAPNTWIIDTVIDCFVNYLTNKEREKTSLEMRIWYLPTIFSQKIVANMDSKKKSSIEDFVKNHNIRDKYMSELAIYVPINDGFAHWYLAVLIVKTQTVEIWDSLPSINKNYKVPELDVPSSYDIPSTAQAEIQSGRDGSNSIYWDDKSMYELTAEDVIGKRFASLEEATDFYKKYSKIMGFSVRIYDGRRDTNGAPIMKHWVCSREGERDKKYIEHTNRIREPRAITRVNCRAAFRVNLDKESKTWVARSFVPKHSHELAADFETQFLRSHRMVKDSDNALANSMQTVGIKTSQIMDFFVNQAGGYDNLGFGLKDLYNNLDNKRRSMILETDSEAALAYLNAKADMDPDFFCKYSIDEENRLANLFWADSIARLDYSYFGDVLAFDSTYKTNEYGKPLVILLGVNNHYATSYFGCAILTDETVETYTWVLKTFLCAMNNRKPISIVTDGDRAMRKAIKKVVPEARHRLCIWHLQRNAQSNVHKTPEFVTRFKDFLLGNYRPEEFEQLWQNMVEELGLQNNDWVKKIYSKRERWAEAFLRGHFFGGMRTTQRCEGMNAYMNRFLQRKLKLHEFVRQIDRALRRTRNNNLGHNFKTKHSIPMISTHLPSLEKHAAGVYTQKLFYKVRKQIYKEGQFILLSNVTLLDIQVYTLTRHLEAKKKWTVVYYLKEQHFECSCKKFESIGIPCPHLFCVMKHMHVSEIPASLINKRWTMDVKVYKQSLMPLESQSKDVLNNFRYGSLNAEFNEISFYASKSDAAYWKLKSHLAQLKSEIKELRTCDNGDTDRPCSAEKKARIVKDPLVVKTKGAPSTKFNKGVNTRKCGYCKQDGHTARKCPSKNGHVTSVDNFARPLNSFKKFICTRNPQQFLNLFNCIGYRTPGVVSGLIQIIYAEQIRGSPIH